VLKKIVLSSDEIAALFSGTDFGGAEKTDIGRRGLMCECVLKRASGYCDGHTINDICVEAGLVQPGGWLVHPSGIRWVFDQIYICGGGPTFLERLNSAEKEASNG
jgi:hypothetical protein